MARFFFCWLLRDHDWTCNAEENIPPTHEQVIGGVAGFWSYAQMWCRRCGKRYEPKR
jgi:hypothetical protein